MKMLSMGTHSRCKALPAKRTRLALASLFALSQFAAAGTALAVGTPGPNDVTLTPGVLDESEYGFGWGSGIHQGGLVAWFESDGKPLMFTLSGYDIDSDSEVKVQLNGVDIGYLSPGTDNGMNNGDSFLLNAQAGMNEIRFVLKKPINRLWGITDLLLSGVNKPPSVSLDAPGPDASFASGVDVVLEAMATDDDGSITLVEFFAGAEKLGEDATAPYSFVWSNAPTGNYSITAVAKDDKSSTTVSDPVSITVCDDDNGNYLCDDEPPAASVIDTALAGMAPNTWRKINLNQYQDVWTPVELQAQPSSPSQNISGWSGGTWDSLRDKFYIWGGNIGNEEGNEIYAFNAVTGLWERGSLPSAIPSGYGVSKRPYVIGGIFDAPLSGESWDNVVYLENMDRMAVIGISRNSNTWKDSDGTPTGPYFWDPAKADPNKVGGSDGTGVDPDTRGGHMWENRDNQATHRHGNGATILVDNNGVDEVLFSDSRANLFRYRIDPFNAANDTWTQLAARPNSGISGDGPAAYDPVRKIYVRPGVKANSLLFWDLNRESEGVFKGETVMLDPSLGLTMKFGTYGLDYDPVLDKLVLWGGDGKLLFVDFEDLISVEPTNIANVRGFFRFEEVTPAGMDKPFDPRVGKFTGVYGKWQYMKDKNAFIGVIDPFSGDVYVYKGNDQPSPPLPAEE